MRIMTWNVWGRGQDWLRRQAGIETTLLRLGPDVIALQEVWREPGNATHVDRLARTLDQHSICAHPAIPAITGRGLAILSRWPIVDHVVHELPCGDAAPEHRIALTATIEIPQGPVLISTTHLNWQPGHSHIRQHQLTYLVDALSQKPFRSLPLILCGDFNAAPASDEIRSLTGLRETIVPGVVFLDAWDAGGDGTPGNTWSHRNPHAALQRLGNARLDYIFIRWAGISPIVHTEVIDGDRSGHVWPSDHLGVLTELDAATLTAAPRTGSIE